MSTCMWSSSPKPAPLRNWLLPVAPLSERVSPDVDRFFSEAATAARAGDLLARDALFAAFLPRFERSIRRFQSIWTGQSRQSREDAIEPDDIAQEAYLVFVDLLDAWHPDESVSAHLTGRFYWRLNDVIRGWRRQRTRQFLAALAVSPVGGSIEIDNEIAELIDAIAVNLDAETKQMLLWRVGERLTFPQIAQRAGVSRRTVRRRWELMVKELTRTGVLHNEIG